MIIKLKRSEQGGKIPQITDLTLGELALNTIDGKVYFKKGNTSGTATEEVISLGTVGSDRTGTPSVTNNIWVGTQAQYDVLGTYLPDVLYFIKA